MMKGWTVKRFYNNQSGRFPEISRSKQREEKSWESWWKMERSGNNLIITRYSDFYNILFISLHNYLSRNATKLLIETNLLWENEA